MPYGLFDFEDTIEPMGSSTPYGQWDSEAFYKATQLKQDIAQGIAKPAPTPQNTGIVTRAFPENPPQQMVTMAIPENPPSQQLVTDMAYGENSPPYNPVTLAIPEGGFPPTPPSGQCPTGYQSSNQSSPNVRPVKPPSGGGAQFYDKQVQVGSGLGTNVLKSSGSGGGSVTAKTPVSIPATAPSYWTSSQKDWTQMLQILKVTPTR